MRKVNFAIGEHYHVFNRGVDKRDVFSNQSDLNRFFQSMQEFNSIEPIGSIYENSFNKEKPQLGSSTSKLVNFIAYCLNPNHFHFILEQVSEKGIEKFMQRLGTGYSKYFNNKYKRSGSLFQGRFKSVHIDSNEYLLHLSAYVNLNDRQLGSSTSKLSMSSWKEYIGENKDTFCEKDIILGQFESKEEYEKFALSSLEDIKKRKGQEKGQENYMEYLEVKLPSNAAINV